METISSKGLIKFEEGISDLFEQGYLPYMIHFSGGNEDQLIDIFKNINEEDWVISTHRNHYHYLLKGGNEKELKRQILSGGSMFVYNKKIKFISTSIVAGGCAIATGIALGIKRSGGNEKVWCFVGDGAEDSGNFYEAVRYVHGFHLPCTFIIEDNDRSVFATKRDRWNDNGFSWYMFKVLRYKYEPKYPHTGNGTNKTIKFKKC